MLLSCFVKTFGGASSRDEAFFAEIVNLMKTKSVGARYIDQRREVMRVLGEAVRSPLVGSKALSKSSDVSVRAAHRFTAGILPLARETDMEVDFFENMSHIQRYRRIRALRKAAKEITVRSYEAKIFRTRQLYIASS